MARVKNTPNRNNANGNQPKTQARRSGTREVRCGTKILKVSERMVKEIKRLQRTTNLLLPKQSFYRVIREILQQHAQRIKDLKVQKLALEALQEAAEIYVTQLFEDSIICAHHANRVTLRCNDIRLVMSLRKAPINH